MSLLSPNPLILEASPAQSLGELWHEAEFLGTVEVRKWSGAYDVTISFTRRSGTRIYATGKDSKIEFAVANAINEAREMGAGENG